jgi:hypothetical protein
MVGTEAGSERLFAQGGGGGEEGGGGPPHRGTAQRFGCRRVGNRQLTRGYYYTVTSNEWHLIFNGNCLLETMDDVALVKGMLILRGVSFVSMRYCIRAGSVT